VFLLQPERVPRVPSGLSGRAATLALLTSSHVFEKLAPLLVGKKLPHSRTKFACFPFGDSRAQAKSECDWVVMSSMFVVSQSRANRFAWWKTGFSQVDVQFKPEV
jgi:hypothetical protein